MKNENKIYIVAFGHKNAFYMTIGAPKNATRSKVIRPVKGYANALAYAEEVKANGGYDIEIFPYN